MKTGTLILICGVLIVTVIQMGFAQWTPVNGPTSNVMYLSASGPAILAQTNTGFFYSTDNGVHWSQGNSGIADSLVNAFPADSANYLLNNILYQIPTLPGGSNLVAAGIDFSSLAALVTSLSILYPETTLDSIYVSLDTGSTALKLSQILSSLALYAAGVDTADILSDIDIAKMQLSTDGGADWISVQAILSGISVRAAEKNQNYLFVGTNRGVFRAATNNTSWSQVNSGLADTNVHALATLNTMLFAGTNGGVFLTTNNGTTWNSVNTGLTNKKVLSLAVAGNYLFAATNGGGVFAWVSSSGSWKAVNQGLTYLFVNALAVSDNTLFAGTSGGGLWKRPVSEMVTGIKGGNEATPESFSLFQNYPNPFNPSTVISYQLPTKEFVTLKVYDFLGREVETLINGNQNAGIYSATFNADKLASGVYFCRLQAGTYRETRKLLLLK